MKNSIKSSWPFNQAISNPCLYFGLKLPEMAFVFLSPDPRETLQNGLMKSSEVTSPFAWTTTMCTMAYGAAALVEPYINLLKDDEDVFGDIFWVSVKNSNFWKEIH